MSDDFPTEWKLSRLETSLDALIDYRGKTPTKTTFGIPLITAKIIKGGRIEEPQEFIAESEFDEWMRRGMPRPGDVVMTTEAPLGEIAQLDDRKVALAQRVIALRGKSGYLDNTFLRFLMQSAFVQDQLEGRASGTTVMGIRQSELRGVMLVIPPIAEQRAIARVLVTLDEKIELNRRMNRTLEELAATLFRSWFVDFDPVVAKAAGRPPAYLRPDHAALFPAHFQASELGEVPQGWEVKKASEVYSNLFDGPHATPGDSQSGPVFLGIKNLSGTHIDLSDVRYIAEADFPKWTRRVTPSENDIVFTYEATLGYFAIIPKGLRCCLGRRLALVRCRAELTHFLFHTFTGDAFQAIIRSHAWHGSTVDRTPLTEFGNYPVLWPGEKLASAFGEIASRWWAAIHHNERESRTLETLRDTLLPKLLSGELRVKQVERLVEDHA